MIDIRTVTVTRYVAPLRDGSSLPGPMEADDLGTHVVKYRNRAMAIGGIGIRSALISSSAESERKVSAGGAAGSQAGSCVRQRLETARFQAPAAARW